MTFMILLKLYVWEKSASWVKHKNALGQSDCRIFKLWYLKGIYQVYISGTYLLKLQIDDVILDGHGQAYPGKP